jgi:hypothetical protein
MGRARRRIRLIGAALSLGAGAYWLATVLLFEMTYYGDEVTVSAREGYLAIYWGEQAEDRNTLVVNNFSWPFFPASGAGMGWTSDWRWETSGPSTLLSRSWWAYQIENPKRLGFYAPGISSGSSGRQPAYVGIPSWTPLVIGLSCVACTCRRRSQSPTTCAGCSYDRAGLPLGANCPECGAEAPRERTQSDRAHRAPRKREM